MWKRQVLDPGLRTSRRLLWAWRLQGTSEACSNGLETMVGFCSAGVGHSELGQGRPAAERMWARGTPGMAKGLGAITGALPGAASTGRRTGQQKAISSLVQQCVQSWAEAAEGSHGLQGQKSARGPQGLGDKSDGSCVDGAAAPSEPEGSQPRGSRGECPCARRRGQTPPPRHGPGIPGKGSSGGLRVAAGGESQAT